jgi:hypothetical protein
MEEILTTYKTKFPQFGKPETETEEPTEPKHSENIPPHILKMIQAAIEHDSGISAKDGEWTKS